MNRSFASILLMATASPALGELVFNSFSQTPPPAFVVFSHDAGESSSTDELPGGFEAESQSGHILNLAGSSRFVTRIDARVEGFRNGIDPPVTVSFATTLRAYTLVNGLPSALIWEGTSEPSTLSLTTGGRVFWAPISFTPNVQFPDSFVVTVSHSQITGQTAGWLIGSAGQTLSPATGSVGSTWFSQDTASGLWSTLSDTSTLQLQIEAVPTPGSIAVVAGAAALASARRRRK